MTPFDRQWIDLIGPGVPFSANDVTDDGAITVAGDHTPNGKQNAIGSRFRTYAAQGLIEKTGRVLQSTAPHRKGGMIQEWVATEKGRRWARRSRHDRPRRLPGVR